MSKLLVTNNIINNIIETWSFIAKNSNKYDVYINIPDNFKFQDILVTKYFFVYTLKIEYKLS